MKPLFTRRRLLLQVAMIALLGTVLSASEVRAQFTGSQTVHPTEENLNPERIDNRISKDETVSEDPRFSEIADKLLGADPIRSIGVRDGELEYMFGWVSGVATDENDHIYVADSQYSEIKVYNYEGAFQSRIGRAGEGPGEFRRPYRMSRDGAGRLLVADEAAARISIFFLEGGSATYVGELHHGMPPIRFCSFGEDIYVRGYSPHEEYEGGIQVFSEDGAHIGAFGEVYRTDDEDQKIIRTRGPIACHPESDTIIAGFSGLPIIRGYAKDGSLRWVSKIEDFNPTRRIAYAGGGTTSDEDQDVSDAFVNMQALSGGYALVQIAHRTRQSAIQGRQYEKVHSYLLEVETGEGTYVGEQLPLIYEIRNDYFVGTTLYPYPQITIFEY